MEKVMEKNVPVPNKDISYLEGEDKIQIEELLSEFNELFSDVPGLTHVAQHEIDIGNNAPCYTKPYRYTEVKEKIIEEHIQEMLKNKIIIPTQSNFASPVVLCKKKTELSPENYNAWRFAVDYRKLTLES